VARWVALLVVPGGADGIELRGWVLRDAGNGQDIAEEVAL
jgi:hypothetical protein